MRAHTVLEMNGSLHLRWCQRVDHGVVLMLGCALISCRKRVSEWKVAGEFGEPETS